jgi:hypothetical protein
MFAPEVPREHAGDVVAVARPSALEDGLAAVQDERRDDRDVEGSCQVGVAPDVDGHDAQPPLLRHTDPGDEARHPPRRAWIGAR